MARDLVKFNLGLQPWVKVFEDADALEEEFDAAYGANDPRTRLAALIRSQALQVLQMAELLMPSKR